MRTPPTVLRRAFYSSYLSQNPRGGAFSPLGYGNPLSMPINTVVKFVPQQQAWVVERFGRFQRILEPGLAILLPFVDQVRYVKTLKEVAVEIPRQAAITQDNVTIAMDGVLYYRIVDPFKACYGVEDADFAINQLAQTTMRSELGKLTLDKTLAERNQLNDNIVAAINDAAVHWGIRCLRYEIRDIQPPESVVKAMHSQVSAERQKRALILESEGARQSAINRAEGDKQATILASEADRQDKINKAVGEAEAVLQKARANAAAIALLGSAIRESNGPDAVSLMVAERYLDAFRGLAKEANTLLLPTNVADPAAMIASSLGIYRQLSSFNRMAKTDSVVQ